MKRTLLKTTERLQRALKSRPIVVLFFVLFSGLLWAGDTLKLPFATTIKLTLIDTFSPLFNALKNPLESVSNLPQSLGDLMASREQIAKLRTENKALLTWKARAQTLEIENTHLRSELQVLPQAEGRVVVGQVISTNSGPFAQSILINVGRQAGALKDCPVIARGGLVGRIVEAGEKASRVLLVQDLNSKIPVMVEKSQVQGVIAGDNTPLLKLKLLPKGISLNIGDRVVTSGKGGLFPPGIIVGKIVETRRENVIVFSTVKWGELNYIHVLQKQTHGLEE